MRFTFIVLALLTITTTCSAALPPEATPAVDSAAHLPHQAYVKAINSTNPDAVRDMLTDDVVFMAPSDKPVKELVVSADWAFERDAWGADHPAK